MKSCHFPEEIEHEAMWDNEEGAVSNQRVNDFNMLDEFCLVAYESAALY